MSGLRSGRAEKGVAQKKVPAKKVPDLFFRSAESIPYPLDIEKSKFGTFFATPFPHQPNSMRTPTFCEAYSSFT